VTDRLCKISLYGEEGRLTRRPIQVKTRQLAADQSEVPNLDVEDGIIFKLNLPGDPSIFDP
jgi:hypothetical protein